MPNNKPFRPSNLLLQAFSCLILLLIAFILLLIASQGFCEEINWDKLVQCIIKVESNGNPNAVSPQGCIGLMQINPNGALKEWNMYSEYGAIIEMTEPPYIEGAYIIAAEEKHFPNPIPKSALYNKVVNRTIGTWYLKRLKNHYLKDNYTSEIKKFIERMLAAYNGGITRLRRNNYDIDKMSRETRNYIKKVMSLYNDRI